MTKREEDLFLLVEILTKELFSLGLGCNDVRVAARKKLIEFASEKDVEFEDVMDFDGIREYDQELAKTVNRVGDLIHLASERTNELRAGCERSGD
jgi:hypothetical protein